ncbi:hypothetical protein ACFFMN_01990 [Planobispora siamensis]|uniref:PRC-barrel domain-containing protein n=1 Tax=Planobispora siamensis TaxID=936338 RepID=A0A8J3SNP4_9ACTN|nr:hypothetical protein [Planobispora siamensis]GIH92923.1 hypothetical protein Psi01_35530 [Planobispora siamensis]
MDRVVHFGESAAEAFPHVVDDLFPGSFRQARMGRRQAVDPLKEKSSGMTDENLWSYRPDVYAGDRTLDLIGFDVETPADGKVGRVAEESTVPGDSYIVVDMGSLISQKKVKVPAGLVSRVDPRERRIHLSVNRAEIETGPVTNGSDV